MVIKEVRSKSVTEWQFGVKGVGSAFSEVQSTDLDCEDERSKGDCLVFMRWQAFNVGLYFALSTLCFHRNQWVFCSAELCQCIQPDDTSLQASWWPLYWKYSSCVYFDLLFNTGNKTHQNPRGLNSERFDTFSNFYLLGSYREHNAVFPASPNSLLQVDGTVQMQTKQCLK